MALAQKSQLAALPPLSGAGHWLGSLGLQTLPMVYVVASVSAPADLSFRVSRALRRKSVEFLVWRGLEYWLLSSVHLAPLAFCIMEIPTNLQLPPWALPYFLLLLWIIWYFSGAQEHRRENKRPQFGIFKGWRWGGRLQIIKAI